MEENKGVTFGRVLQSYHDFTIVLGVLFQVVFLLFAGGYIHGAVSWIDSEEVTGINNK